MDLRSLAKIAMDRFKVLNCRGATKIEFIFTNTAVPGAMALTCCDAREGVFDSGALAKHAASAGGLLKLSKRCLQRFVLGNGNGSQRAVARALAGDFPVRRGQRLRGCRGEAGPRVEGLAVGDEVIGFTDVRASHAEYVLAEAKT